MGVVGNTCAQEMGQEDQKFKASLGYMKCYLSEKEKEGRTLGRKEGKSTLQVEILKAIIF